jgi:methyl-accepting chemotaxis protein
MSIQFSLCGSLFEKINLSLNCFRSKSKDKVQTIIEDINILLANNDNHREFICNHILNKIIQITNSEYGFIGKILKNNNQLILHTYSFTNIAWNASSHQFYLDHLNHGLLFTNMETLFGRVMKNNKSMIFNKYDIKRSFLPKGHPIIKRFMGVVSNTKYNDHSVVMVGLCNKMENFNQTDIKNVEKILDILAYLFIDLNNFNSEKNKYDEIKNNADKLISCMKRF